MSTSTCPKCSEKVTVPAGGSPESRVRCPLCQEEYLLGEALDKLPPMLILLDGPVAKHSSYTPFAAAPAYAAAATGAMDATSAPPYEANLSEIPSAYLSPSEESFGTATEHGEELAPGEELGLEPLHGDTATEEESLQGVDEASPTPAKIRPSKPRKKKQKSPIVFGIQVVGGGFIGIGLALVFLLWLPINPFSWKKPTRDQRDPAHMASILDQYVPWIVPADLHEELERDAAKKAEKGKVKVAANNVNKKSAPSFELPKNGGGMDTNNFNPGGQNPEPSPNVGVSPLSSEPKSPDGFELPNAAPKPTVPDFGKPDVATPSFDEPKIEKPSPPPAAKPILRNAPALAEDALEQTKGSLEVATDTWMNSANGTREERLAAASGFYGSLSKLGETAVYLSSAKQLKAAQVAEIRELAGGIVAAPKNAGAVNGLAGPWLDNASRTNSGVALLGTVKSVSPQGPHFLTELELSSKDKRLVTVLSTTSPAYDVDQKVMVLGMVVENPSDSLEGYDGPSQPVVLSGVAFAP